MSDGVAVRVQARVFRRVGGGRSRTVSRNPLSLIVLRRRRRKAYPAERELTDQPAKALKAGDHGVARLIPPSGN